MILPRSRSGQSAPLSQLWLQHLSRASSALEYAGQLSLRTTWCHKLVGLGSGAPMRTSSSAHLPLTRCMARTATRHRDLPHSDEVIPSKHAAQRRGGERRICVSASLRPRLWMKSTNAQLRSSASVIGNVSTPRTSSLFALHAVPSMGARHIAPIGGPAPRAGQGTS